MWAEACLEGSSILENSHSSSSMSARDGHPHSVQMLYHIFASFVLPRCTLSMKGSLHPTVELHWRKRNACWSSHGNGPGSQAVPIFSFPPVSRSEKACKHVLHKHSVRFSSEFHWFSSHLRNLFSASNFRVGVPNMLYEPFILQGSSLRPILPPFLL